MRPYVLEVRFDAILLAQYYPPDMGLGTTESGLRNQLTLAAANAGRQFGADLFVNSIKKGRQGRVISRRRGIVVPSEVDFVELFYVARRAVEQLAGHLERHDFVASAVGLEDGPGIFLNSLAASCTDFA